MKVLVADGSDSDRMQIRSYLQWLGHEAILAEDGVQAIKLFKQTDPDLVLLDIHGPNMDGYEVLDSIRKHDLEWRPIIFLSGDTGIEDYVSGIRLGGDDTLYKPLDNRIFEAKLIALERIVAMRKELIAVTAELAWESEKARQLANQDGLTGLANRRYLNDVFEVEIKRSIRSKQHIAVIMIDIDYFKQFNDFYGHLMGDDVLMRVGKILNGSVNRAGDIVARYGGEEFCCVLPSTNENGARAFAEILRRSIEAEHIPHAASTAQSWVTISLGVTSCIPKQGSNVDRLIQLADQALYAAKEGGRNQVCFMSDDTGDSPRIMPL